MINCCLWNSAVTVNQPSSCLHHNRTLLKGWVLSSSYKGANNKDIYHCWPDPHGRQTKESILCLPAKWIRPILVLHWECTIHMVDHRENTSPVSSQWWATNAWWILGIKVVLAWSTWQMNGWGHFPSAYQADQANNDEIFRTHHECDGSPLFYFFLVKFGRPPYKREDAWESQLVDRTCMFVPGIRWVTIFLFQPAVPQIHPYCCQLQFTRTRYLMII